MQQLIHTLVGVIGVLSLLENVSAFTTTTTIRPFVTQQQQQQNRAAHNLDRPTRWKVALHASSRNPSQSPNNNPQKQQPPLVRSRLPHQLSNGRGTFLGFRNTKDMGSLCSTVEALMPDGGLSPCVIRVLGVGGGGCNAVRVM